MRGRRTDGDDAGDGTESKGDASGQRLAGRGRALNELLETRVGRKAHGRVGALLEDLGARRSRGRSIGDKGSRRLSEPMDTHDGAQSTVDAEEALSLDNLFRTVDETAVLRYRPPRVLDELRPARSGASVGATAVSKQVPRRHHWR
jgi:hypothetical protein